MWTIVIVVSVLLIGLILYLERISKANKAYEKEYENIFNAHKAIGYPHLTDEQQFDILDTENTSYISKLTQYDFIPTGLLNHYIDIDPDKYLKHLMTQDLEKQMRFDPNNLTDGFFINKTDEGYEYLFVERQHIEFRKKFQSFNQLLKYLVYDRLKLHAPKKYEHIDKKYYA